MNRGSQHQSRSSDISQSSRMRSFSLDPRSAAIGLRTDRKAILTAAWPRAFSEKLMCNAEACRAGPARSDQLVQLLHQLSEVL